MSALIGFAMGAGEAGSRMAQQHLKSLDDRESEERAVRLRAEVEEAKETRLMKLRSQNEVDSIGPKAKATADALLANAPTSAAAASVTAKSAAQDAVDTAPLRGRATRDALIGGELSDEVISRKLSVIAQEATTRGKAETDALIARGNNPDAVRATRNLAQAGHVESAGSSAQAALANLGLDEKRKVAELVSQYEKTDDPKVKAKIKESLIVRGVLKAEEQQTDKVTTETFNPDGSTTKTERTVKRKGGETAGTDKPAQEDVHAQARAAIAGGAPAAAVNKRLQELGYAPLEADKKAAKPKTEEKKPEPAYTPPAGSRAAQALAEREQQRQRERTSTDEGLISSARRRMEQEEEDRKKAKAFREKNKVD